MLGGGSHYEDSQKIMFYPGNKCLSTLYNEDGTKYSGTLYTSGGHLTIRYVGGSVIQDTKNPKEITYIPGTGGSIIGSPTIYKRG